MFDIGIPEIVIIVLVFGILFFGSGKITDIARSIGRVGGEYKKGKADIEREMKAGHDSAGDTNKDAS